MDWWHHVLFIGTLLTVVFLVVSVAHVIIKDFMKQAEEMLNRVLYEGECECALKEKEKME